jgi:hypothetical protein
MRRGVQAVIGLGVGVVGFVTGGFVVSLFTTGPHESECVTTSEAVTCRVYLDNPAPFLVGLVVGLVCFALALVLLRRFADRHAEPS